MVAMATALTLLVEIAIQFCRIHDRRKANERPEWLDVDDEQGSGPITASGPIGSAGGIGDVGGIDAPTSVSTPTSIHPGGMPTASATPTTSPISGPTPVNAPTPTQASQMRPTRNSRPPRPHGMIPETPMPTKDLRNRPTSDFDDVL